MEIFNNIIQLDNKNYGLLGLTDESFCVYINEVFIKNDKSILIVAKDLIDATNLLNSLLCYTTDVLFFPMEEFLSSVSFASSPELTVTRLETINEILTEKKKIVITSLMGYLHFLPSKEIYRNSVIHLVKNQEYDMHVLAEKLINIGYKRDTIVSKTTDVAIRGYVVDIFPIGYSHPVRIEYFGDTIESIRLFNEETQLSLSELEKIDIYPATDILIEKTKEGITYQSKDIYTCNKVVASITDYLNDYSLVVKDYSDLQIVYKEVLKQIKEYNREKDIDYHGQYMFSLSKIPDNGVVYYLNKDNLLPGIIYDEIKFKIKEVPKFHENIERINEYLQSNLNNVLILCLKKNQIQQLTKYLEVPYFITDFNLLQKGIVNIVPFDMNEGFIYQDFIILTDKELFNTRKTAKTYRTKFKYSTTLKSLDKLEIGDAVVHSIHGIGLYNGIKTLTSFSITKDYIEILYKGNDKLYIPVEKIGVISKFTGREGMIPRVNSLGGTDWQKTKRRITDKVKDVAASLLKISAERKMQDGFKFEEDNELQLIFEEDFPYTPTQDQILSTKQIKEEMETPHPMDRLLCGDVGFGKTEVAFRAIFKAISNSKQVLYLCPTTILSMQIYRNAKERFKNFPVNIALLNRFTKPKDVKRIINDLKEKKIDFLIGTHRLLSSDVIPGDLGLLVIDEEQRFGVTHKEKLKKYKANVDILTLTATPIPRTLQMSLVGLRSLSLMETPPVNRYPIQTYVVGESKQLIREAINKEISRGGQVFLLYNRVETILNKVAEIQELVPKARIIYAHGKMNRDEIEEKMIDFINYEADVLVCTTIIETGIDIPNVNTLIILDADRYGLSQLYQIRGRVGRSDKIAYAYMMYREGHILTEQAVKRLNTIKEFTELGSGFKIASRDLSIRGAGDILGEEQSGFIDTVGIDLYLKILNEEVMRLKGLSVEEEEDTKALINVSTHIDSKYTDESDLKIEIHRLINSIDSYDKMQEIKNEIEDRFGKINHDIEIYMYEEWFDKLAKDLNIVRVNQTKTFVELTFDEIISKSLNYEELFIKSSKISRYFKFKCIGNNLHITLELPRLERHFVYYLIDLLLLIKKKQ